MPFYDLRCQLCHHEQIDVQEPVYVSDLVRRCPICGGRVERICAPAFVVKGYNAANHYSKEG